MGKKFNRCLSMLLALIITSSSAIAAAADTVDVVDEPDVLNEPYTFEWTEDAQTDEIEVKSDVLDEDDKEAVSEDVGNTDETAEEEDTSQESEMQESASPEPAQPEPAQPEPAQPEPAQPEKAVPESSGELNSESEQGTDGDITWTYDGESKTLTISGEGEMPNYGGYYQIKSPWYNKDFEKVVIEKGVKRIGNSAFSSKQTLTSITIPDSVISIGTEAFSYCKSLESVLIPESVTSIEDYAFRGCTGLTSVKISNSVTTIEEGAFRSCESLTSVTIPNSINTIKRCTFYDCYNLTSVTIPDSVKSIEEYAFSGCYKLTNITIPNSVEKLSGFDYCRGLTSITIPDSVTSIGGYAFSGCTGLTSITIPDSVTSIGDYAFSDCTGLKSVTIPDSVTSIGDYAFSACTGLTSIAIPDSVTSIAGGAFNGCTGLTSITIPDSVTSISYGAFSGCSELTSITIPDSVTSIGRNAFRGCTGLTSITIPDSVTSISSSAFSGCTGLTSVTIPNSVQYLSGFDGCTGLTSITIPDSVTSISYSAFSGCTGLTSVSIPDSVKSIGYYAFSGCTGLTSITIPDSVTSIGDCAFSGCTGLTSVTIPDSVTSIGGYAFSGCTGLTSITIPDSVTSIGNYVFSGCTGLTSVTIPDSVTSISSSAFSGCTGLTSITIPDSVTSIESYAFSGCTGLTSITIPDSVTSISYSAFSGCTGLTSVSIPDSVKIIGYYAFSGCTGLTSITIPDSVTSIGDCAFYHCTGLTSITIPDSVTSISYSAFSGCTGLTSVSIPDSVKSIGYYAFSGCTGLKNITIPNSVETLSGFSSCTGLTSVKIPNSVKSIKRDAFYGCTGLTSITIPDSVKSIEDSAFSGCTGIISITIPDSVTSIGSKVFNGCSDNLTIYCQPDSYAQEYAENNNIKYFVGESTGDLTVNISDTYKGLNLKLTSGKNNRIVCTRIIDKNQISIYGLSPTSAYKAEIVSDIGSVFGTIENIKLTDGSVKVTFSDTKQICTVSAVVKSSDNIDVTDYCTVKWYSEDGTYLKEGKTLGNVAQGDVFKYRITFNSDIFKDSFVTPEEQTVTVNSENTKAEYVLSAIPTFKLSGKVVDTDENPIKNANISLTQNLDKKNIKTLTTRTDSDGCFNMQVKNAPSQLVVKAKGYEIYSESFDSVPENEITITLKKVETSNVALNITKQELDSSEEKAETLGGMEFNFKNETTGKEIKGYSVSYSNLVLPLNEVSEGDRIAVTASSDGYITAETSFIFGTDSTVSLKLVQQGRLVLVQKEDDTNTNMAIIFDSNGNYVDTLTMKHQKTTRSNTKEGEYSLIIMNKSYRYYSPSTLKEFNGYGLEENKDYIKSAVKVENAKTTTVDNISVPAIDENKSSFLNSEKTSISINKSSVTLGQYVYINLDYAFNDNVDVSDVKINLSIPNNFLLMPNCITVNNEAAVFTNQNGNISIPVDELSGTLRIALRAASAAEYCSVSANVSFNSSGSEIKESVGSVSCLIKSFDFYVPSRSNSTTVCSMGSASPNSKIDYYDNDVLVGTTKSGASGSYEIEFELNNPFNHSEHYIYAVVTTENNYVLRTGTKLLKYSSDNIVAERLNIHHGNGSFSILLNKKQERSLYYSFNPKKPTFTFELVFDGDASQVSRASVTTKTQNGEYIDVLLQYDPISGNMVGSYEYTTATRPSAVSVAYSVDSSYVFDYQEMLSSTKEVQKSYENYNNAIGNLRTAVEELEDSKTVKKDDLISSLKEYGFTDETLAAIDLDEVLSEVNSDLTDYVNELTEGLENAGKDTTKELDSVIKDLNDQYDSQKENYQVCRISDSVTADQLISEGYNQIQTYDDSGIIFKRGSDENQYDYIDLTQGYGIITADDEQDKTPNSSGAALDIYSSLYCSECSHNMIDFSIIRYILEDVSKRLLPIQDKLKVMLGGIEMIENSQSLLMISSAAAYPLLVPSDLGSADIKNPQLQKLAEKVGYNRAHQKYYEKVRATNKAITKVVQPVKAVIETINDVIEFGQLLSVIDNLRKQCCKCTNIAVERLNAAISEIKWALAKSAANLVLSVVPQTTGLFSLAKSIWSKGISCLNSMGVIDDNNAQALIAPIETAKRTVWLCIERAEMDIADCPKWHCCDHDGEHPEYPIPIRSGVDPSGYVCEAVSSNRIEGVTTTLYYSDNKDGKNAVIWDAGEYEQQNPLISDSEGHYEWYVPEGWWQVKFEKAGYETAYSDWVPVLPIQTEINVSMNSLYAPTVKYVNAYSNAVDITFSQYMDIEKVNSDTVKISVGGKQITGTLEPLNAEASFKDSDIKYASKFRFVPETTLSGNVKISIDKVKSYNGLYMDSEYTSDVKVKEKIEKIDVPETVEMKYNESTEITLQLLPEKAAANVKVNVKAENDRLLTVENSTVTTDENGKATVKIEGKLPSETELTFSIDELDLKASTKVKLTMPETESHNHTEYMIGDIDGDKSITSADGLFILRRSVDIEKFTAAQDMIADADGDGDITSVDALYVLRYSVKLKDQTKIGETVMLEAS